MPGKKAHLHKNIEGAGMKGVHKQAAPGRKSAGQNEGDYMRDPKGRKGQYTAAGDSPRMQK